ncbi:MAG: NADH-quinone oxidoreductase subunit L [Alphaproteobacteria bacterium]|nr:NADH-quinone oxidoreductase subunit L [Alphaproteobacteria bacterium]
MLQSMLAVLVVMPFILGGICLFVKNHKYRNILVFINSAVLIAVSIAFAFVNRKALEFSDASVPYMDINLLIEAADYILLAVIAYFGYIHKHWAIIFLAAAQVAVLILFSTLIIKPTEVVPFIYADSLANIMVLIVSIIGSLICLFAIPYMKKHEEHLHIAPTRQHYFFAVMIMFLGSMNGLVVSNNLLHVYFFFEFTSLCSFLLIGHDRTFAATRNALKALWMNSLGGLSLLIAVILFYIQLETFDIRLIIEQSFGNSLLLLPLTMVCLAAFIKAAQPPFQSWLLGAMVAPTPTSALLHSSTMVKVGVYLALRFSPAYLDSFLATCIALFGAFVFVSNALLAIGQSNGKKILAYSTISNLGLIFACAGIGTVEAITAGVFLIIFHAVSKALLFLCVGTIEQRIGSRDIEDMRGVYRVMPVTSIITLIGIISIILPPFGMLMGKWIAMEAASAISLPVVVILAFGSSATVIYWARWAGVLTSFDTHPKITPEPQAFLTRFPLVVLCALAVILSFLAPYIFDAMIMPLVSIFGVTPFEIGGVGLVGYLGAFWVAPLFIIFLLAVMWAVHIVRKEKDSRKIKPFMCGVNGDEPETFIGPMETKYQVKVYNYYFMAFCSEAASLKCFNVIALAILGFMIGGAIQFSQVVGGYW